MMVRKKKWRWREAAVYFNKKLLAGLVLFFFFLIGAGYPQIILALWSGGIDMAKILSPEHSQPKLGLAYFFSFVRNYFFVFEFVAIWIFITWMVSILKRGKERILSNSPYATIALVHVVLFLALSGQ